jgi:hypothetical protein
MNCSFLKLEILAFRKNKKIWVIANQWTLNDVTNIRFPLTRWYLGNFEPKLEYSRSLITFLFKKNLCIYSYVHTLIGPFLPPALCLSPQPPPRFQAEPGSNNCLWEDISNNKKDKAFLLVEIRKAIERVLALLPCTSVLQPKLIPPYLTFSLVPNHYFSIPL